MKIEHLERLSFKEEEKDINHLKITLGSVEFYKSKIDYGKSSQVTTPDLRYYWDGSRFGLHVSDFDYSGTGLSVLEGIEAQILEKLEVLYFCRTKIDVLNIKEFFFRNLSYINFSENFRLTSLHFYIPENLKEFYVSNCPKLNDLQITISKSNLEKIDISNCSILHFPTEKFETLEYLNIQNNQIADINISQLNKLKYFFAKGNSKLNISWPKIWIHDKLEILGLDGSNEFISKDILEIAKSFSDNELQEKLKAYLNFEQKHGDELVPINRHQIILLGNTTAGKTELKHRLFKEIRTTHDSTHGVQYFFKIIDDIEVMGYDFGGQDYYHALHLPFFDKTSHYILVWGNREEKIWGNYDSFYGKREKREDEILVENLMYPIEYWLKTIDMDSPEKKWRNFPGESKRRIRKEVEFHSKLQHAKANSLDISKEEIEMEIYKPDESVPVVDIIQNVRDKTDELFLNVKSLKFQSQAHARLQDILSFNFLNQEVGSWLRNKIKSGKQTQKNQIVKSVKEFGEHIYNQNTVIIDKITLIEKIKKSKIQSTVENIDVIINSLINNYYLIYPGKDIPELEDYYIVNIQKFTEYLYQVLSIELATNEKNQGYFTKNEAFERILNKDPKIKKYVLEFLRKSEVIFEIEDPEKENLKYVAPSYLPIPKEKIEKLFIESFELPDCEFEFQSFFHPNIILQIVKYYKEKELLVKDDEKLEYLLWKNCVIIYNNNKESKHYLKLELLLPNIDFPDRTPKFTISRSSSGFIENDQFSDVFKEIKNLLSQYRPRIKVKTPYGKYISYDDVKIVISEGLDKRSQFVYSAGVLYPKYDFRHFLGDELNAPIKIFIAYSKFDDAFRLELRDHLYPGIAEGKFIVFDDREMEMGEKWNARLKKELEQCDIFIVLISVKTLGTPYVMNVEIPEAVKRMRNGNLKIIPILVSECDWTKTDLSELNIYDKALPISGKNDNFDLSKEISVNSRAAKWKEIVKQIENNIPNGFNPSNSLTSSDEPISGADKAND